MALSDLLTKGYLPKELPPPFNSQLFANILNLPFPKSWNIKDGRFKKKGRLVRYSHRRVGYLRRQLSIPNPIFHFQTSAVVSRYWRTLRSHLDGSDLATQSPQLGKASRRAFAAKVRRKDIPQVATDCRRSARYVLKADISRFYPSIYTHTIPWALHGKAKAKAHTRDMRFTGNKLDYWIRTAQDRQTVGIPIGPDTSWVVAECLIVSVEQRLKDALDGLKGYTIIDDFELAFATLPEAEKAMSKLESALNYYELSLQPQEDRGRRTPVSVCGSMAR